MAFFDDPKLLTAHLRHSFITSDDTGMCELIMINEDIEKEIKTDNKFSKRSLRLAQRYNPSEHLPRYAKSFDIYASPSIARRPPLKNNANMFEVMERKKAKSAQVKSMVWNNATSNSFEPDAFTRHEIVKKPKDTGPSVLSVLLAEHSKLSANPYFEYSKFNGENHGIAVTNIYHIFISMSKTPLRPITITVLHTATVADLIGLTLWKYLETTRDTVKLRAVKYYSVRIAEEDGDIDTDLPELEKGDRIAKFRFKYLGIVEIKKKARVVDTVQAAPPRPVVKVYYEQGGFSTLAISDYSIDMGEILARVIRKRCLQIHGYELERKDTPGTAVDLNSTLESQKTFDFVLVKNLGRTRVSSVADGEDESDLPDVTFYQYKSYNIIMVNRFKVRSNTEVILGVSGDRIEVEPVGHSRSFFPRSSKSQKPMTYEVKKICSCELLDDKNAPRRFFRIIRLGKDGYKNMDFDAPQGMAKEIVRKLNLILDGVSGGARSEFLEWKEQNKGKKGGGKS